MHDEGYVIMPDGNRLVVIGATSAGVFYGAQTVKQLVSGDGSQARLYRATIRDWPAMRYRGFHDDISRGPVPTLDFQKKQIRTLAAYKVNFFSPYFEHTLDYDSNPLIAPPGGAMTHADVRSSSRTPATTTSTSFPNRKLSATCTTRSSTRSTLRSAKPPHGHVLAPGQPGSIPLSSRCSPRSTRSFPVVSFTWAPTKRSSSDAGRPRTG